MNNRVNKAYIAASGVITSVGCTSLMTAAAVTARISGYKISDYHNYDRQPVTLSLIPEMIFSDFPYDIDEGDNYSAQYDRIIKAAIVALRTVFKAHAATQPLPLVLAMPEPLDKVMHIPPRLLISNLLNQPDLNIAADKVRCIHTGRAAGIQGLDLALRYLYDGGEDYVLLGGSDSHLESSLLNQFDAQRRLLAPGSKDGFAPGEGAAFLLLTRHPERALCHKGHIIALSPPGVAEEPGHLFSDEPYKGDGLDKAFKQALKDHSGSPISAVYSSMNGEHHWAKEYGVAMLRNKPCFHEQVEIEHPAECYGDLGAATGAALMVVAAEHLFKRSGPATYLAYSSSDGSWRAATLMEKLAYQTSAATPDPIRHPALDSDWPETRSEAE